MKRAFKHRWVTPLGRDLATVWAAVQAGIATETVQLTILHEKGTSRCGASIPPRSPSVAAAEAAAIRVIFIFAVAAALGCVRDAGCDPSPSARRRLPATNGGVIFNAPVFRGVPKGTQAGSPLRFRDRLHAPAAPSRRYRHTGIVTPLVTTRRSRGRHRRGL